MAASTSDGPQEGAAAIILTHDGKILLQARDDYPVVGRFGGGRDECDITLLDTIKRELKEELGANVLSEDLVLLTTKVGINANGAVSKTTTFFWHDRMASIMGCYEGAAAYYGSCAEVAADPRVREHTKECVAIALQKGLIS